MKTKGNRTLSAVSLAALLLALLLLACAGCAGESPPTPAVGRADPGAPSAQIPGAPSSQIPGAPLSQTPGAPSSQTPDTPSSPDAPTPTPTPEMRGELTLSVLEETEFLTAAAQMFMEKYPDVTVTVNAFRTTELVELEGGMVTSADPAEGKTDADYLTYMNTRVMSGDAEDILVTDPLPLRKYAEMGVFEDLSPRLAASPELSDATHHMKAFELMRGADGAIYELPLTWTPTQILYFDPELVAESGLSLPEGTKTLSHRAALDFAQKLKDRSSKPNTFLGIGNGINTAYALLGDELANFLDFDAKTANFTDGRFAAILAEARALEASEVFVPRDFDFYNTPYTLAMGDDMGFQAAYYALIADGRRGLSMPKSDAQGRVEMHAYPKVGVNSLSENKALAWEFVKFLLSDEVQTLPSLYGMGVNRAGFDAFLRRELDMYNNGNRAAVAFEDYAGLLYGWMEQINAYTRTESIVTDEFIYPEMLAYFDGTQDADATGRNIQAKIDKYFNE
jgi:multiple sugar transport system substrate-binding protein